MHSCHAHLPSFFALIASAFLTASAAFGQQSQGTDQVALPAQPAALMDLIGDRNALENESLKPWRIVVRVSVPETQEATPSEGKSSPQTQGETVDSPTLKPEAVQAKEIRIEETWVNSHHFKISYQLGDKTWQVYGADTNSMLVGEQASGPDFWSQALHEFENPIPAKNFRASWILQEKDQALGNARLKCLSVAGYEIKGEKRAAQGSTYCIDADKPDLRIKADPFTHSQMVHNGLRIFQGQYVPEKVESLRNGTVVWRAVLETLESLPQVDEATLVAPPDAKPVIKKVQISAEVAQGQISSMVRPAYPPQTLANGIQGMVVLQGTISRDGIPINLRVVSGNQQLQMAALDAVKQWRYKPYLLNGEPVQVETTINVVFHLGR
jgi:TonB family protein